METFNEQDDIRNMKEGLFGILAFFCIVVGFIEIAGARSGSPEMACSPFVCLYAPGVLFVAYGIFAYFHPGD